jgi:alkylation response protein AidB-like acyl-CoA dehydrogenase
MAARIEATRLFLYKGCWQLDREHETKCEVASPFLIDAANFYIKDMMVQVCQIAAEVLSGFGATTEQPLEAFVLRTFGSYHVRCTPVFNLLKAATNIDRFVPTGD